jgi:hypothetical protein
MLNKPFQARQKAQPAASDSLNHPSTGFSVMPPSPPLQVGGIWQRYRRGAASEKDLLQGLAKQVVELKVPPPLMPGKFRMAAQLAYAPCTTPLETADAIEAFMNWADSNDITVVDGAAV